MSQYLKFLRYTGLQAPANTVNHSVFTCYFAFIGFGFGGKVIHHTFHLDLVTLMCLSIGTPKNNKFSICSKWIIIILRCPKIRAHYSLFIMCLNIETPNNHHFPCGTNGKVVVLGVPILKHFRVVMIYRMI